MGLWVSRTPGRAPQRCWHRVHTSKPQDICRDRVVRVGAGRQQGLGRRGRIEDCGVCRREEEHQEGAPLPSRALFCPGIFCVHPSDTWAPAHGQLLPVAASQGQAEVSAACQSRADGGCGLALKIKLQELGACSWFKYPSPPLYRKRSLSQRPVHLACPKARRPPDWTSAPQSLVKTT